MTVLKLGRPERALGWLEMAQHWAARPGDYDALIGDCWTQLGDDEKAERAYQRSIDLRPDFSEGWVGLCHLRLLQRDFDAARALVQQNRELSNRRSASDNAPDEITAQVEFFARNYPEAKRLYLALREKNFGYGISYGAMTYTSALGRLDQLLGDEIAGRGLLQEAQGIELKDLRPNDPANLYRQAAIESSLGELTPALDQFQAALGAGWLDGRSPRLDPRFDSLAADHRFQKLLASLEIEVAARKQQVATAKPMSVQEASVPKGSQSAR